VQRITRSRTAATVLAALTTLGACSSGSGDEAATSSTRPAQTTTTFECAAAASSIGPGEEKVTISSGGVERWYLRHVPTGYDGSAALPVVVDLHGYSEGADVQARLSALGPYGDEHGFITLTPQGSGTVSRWDTAPSSADQLFIGDVLDQVEADLCVDSDRIFVTGLSNGAMMTSAIGCALSDRIAAIAPVAGIQDPDGCAPARPMPVIAFHGTEDGFLSYDGGYGERTASLPAPDGSGKTLGDLGVRDSGGPSVVEMTSAWAARAGCDTSPAESAVASDVTLLDFPCSGDVDVQLYRIDGGGHTWPGSALSAAVASIIGPTTTSISANALMWAFFEEHPLPHDR
jgi:polyhydroxybutyrate depolymerase